MPYQPDNCSLWKPLVEHPSKSSKTKAAASTSSSIVMSGSGGGGSTISYTSRTHIGVVESCHLYPIKSCHGIRMDKLYIYQGGPVGDRVFALLDTSTNAIATLITHPQLVRVITFEDVRYIRLSQLRQIVVEDGVVGVDVGIRVGDDPATAKKFTVRWIIPGYDDRADSASDINALTTRPCDLSINLTSITRSQKVVRGSKYCATCIDTVRCDNPELTRALSEALGFPCSMVTMHPNAQFQGAQHFVYTAPILMVNSTSYKTLSDQHSIHSYRPNLVVNLKAPWIEEALMGFALAVSTCHAAESDDGDGTITKESDAREGDSKESVLLLELVKKCQRCEVITVHPDDGSLNTSVMKGLSRVRRQGVGGFVFGVYASLIDPDSKPYANNVDENEKLPLSCAKLLPIGDGSTISVCV